MWDVLINEVCCLAPLVLVYCELVSVSCLRLSTLQGALRGPLADLDSAALSFLAASFAAGGSVAPPVEPTAAAAVNTAGSSDSPVAVHEAAERPASGLPSAARSSVDSGTISDTDSELDDHPDAANAATPFDAEGPCNSSSRGIIQGSVLGADGVRMFRSATELRAAYQFLVTQLSGMLVIL